MKFYMSIILCLCFFSVSVQAQNLSWRKHAKLAEQLYKQGEYAEAAEHYESAWQKKTKKKEYIYRAGECYAMIKDYRKAAEAYQYVKEDNKDFSLPGLKYARALKQDGQYDEASRALVNFISAYDGKDKDVVSKVVEKEIQGCELGIQMLQNTDVSNIEFEHLDENVNSQQADFAPVPFSDDVLYYSSNMAGETKMYLTQRHEGKWSRARVPKNFPEISAEHFGNGVFSPDNKKFFYTQCKGVDATGRMTAGCEIFLTTRSDDGWTTPEKVSGSVNKSGSTSTQPYVVHQDGKEMLFFVSDRSGGQGGLDIWFTSRDLGGMEKFGQPRNLGPTVNSMGDEMTPYFDMDENMMYYSSNGNATIGGFDIYRTSGTGMSDWATPENIGLPYNSSADDYYFRRSSIGNGYVVSNRVYGLDKTTSSHDDIFTFSEAVERMMASGNILDGENKENIENVWVALYEKTQDGKTRLLVNEESEGGEYEFNLLEGKDYRIEASADGYMMESVDFSTVATEGGVSNFTKDITLEKLDEVAIGGETGGMNSGKPNGIFNDPRPLPDSASSEGVISSTSSKVKEVVTTPISDVVTSSTNAVATPSTNNVVTSHSETVTSTTAPVTTMPSNNVVTSSPSTMTTTTEAPIVNTPSTISIEDIANGTTAPATNYPSHSSNTVVTTPTTTYPSTTTTTAPAATFAEAGVVYKVQLIAVKRYNESHSRYDNAKNYGSIQTEYISDRDLTRVLLGSFSTKEEAESIRQNMKEQRDFRTAVVVRYENGVRIDPWAK